jgi:GT2 family glycosyltransferase
VWVVDNASLDGSVESAKEKYPSINVIENQNNLGFAAANNFAFKRMKGRYALLLNTDIILTYGAVKELYDLMESDERAGIACGQLLNHDGSKQNSVANFPSLLSLLSNETVLRILFPNKFPSKRKEYSYPIEIDSCIGACMLVRKRAMDEVGFFDGQYFFFFEETDLSYRMKQAGWKVKFVPTARVFHYQGRSVGMGADARIMFYRSRYIYFKKWYLRSYPLIYCIIFARLLVNAALSLLGIFLTLGLKNDLNKKFTTYTQLIAWHFKGCP